MSTSLFPKGTLLSKKQGPGAPFKAIDAAEALFGSKYVMLYFSAHWCPPCRMFTPQLKSFYETHGKSKNLEIVFVSLDNTENEMNDYFRDAHGDWLAMTFNDAKQVGQGLSRQYGIYGIPTVLLFETVPSAAAGAAAEYNLITKNARNMVPMDPAAETFPWRDADAQIAAYRKNMMMKAVMAVSVVVGLFVAYKFLL